MCITPIERAIQYHSDTNLGMLGLSWTVFGLVVGDGGGAGLLGLLELVTGLDGPGLVGREGADPPP